MQRIADFRADEKPNPEYYVRHTVRQAQAELSQSCNSALEEDTVQSSRIDPTPEIVDV